MDELRDGDPQRIGAYRLLGRLGTGGMGLVYLARSDRGRTVAVKLVRQELAAQGEFRDRFRQEVRAARRVGGRWTAPVLDADTEAALPWLATGYIAGPSLQRLIGEHGPLPERSVRILAASLAAALEDIHAAGLVHRDLKPSNVLVTIDGPRVIDFGIARALETVTDGGLTRTGAMVGSPGFMAPEQVRGERITPACDVFCLGSVLVHAATGRPPFGGTESGVPAVLYRIAREEPDLTGLPDGLRELVADCLGKDPAGRPLPAELRERSGADATLGDGRALEPWLPGRVVAQLGRHAVQLLDAENPASADGGPAATDPVAAPPADRPAAGTGHAYGHGLAHGTDPAPEQPYEPAPEHTPSNGSGEDPYGAGPYGSGRENGSGGGPAHGEAHGAPGAGHGDSRNGHDERTDRTDPSGHEVPPEHEDGSRRPSGYGAHGGRAGQGHQGYQGGRENHRHQPPHTAPTATSNTPPPPPPPRGSAPPASTPYYGPPPPGSGYGYGTQQYNTTPGYLPPYRPDHGVHHDGSARPTRHWRISALVTVVALAVAVIGGTTVYTLLKNAGSAADRSRNGASGSQGTPDTPNSPNPDTDQASPSPQPSPGAVPQEYLGTWEAAFGSSEQDVRRFTLAQGSPGDTVFRLDADGPGYHCEFSARLRTGGPPVELEPSTVEIAQPDTACQPGPVTTLEMESDGSLRRVFSEGTEKPLVYTRID